MKAELDSPGAANLWHAIRDRLDRCLPAWTQQIEHFGQVAAVERREAGSHWTDAEVFEALLRAVLSNNTDWGKVERVLPELRDALSGFSLQRYAETPIQDVEHRLVPWFKERKAGSMTLRRSLLCLVETAQILRDWSISFGTAEHYFLDVIASSGGDPKAAAVALGEPRSNKKLPALGVPIAAESLRNMGFDVCKPDRHVCRAMGSFGLLRFHKWSDRTGTKPPEASASEMLETMTVVETMARNVGARPTFVDNAIWLLCAQMGLHMRNAELTQLASDIEAGRE